MRDFSGEIDNLIDNLREYLDSLPWTLPDSEWQKTLEGIQEKTQPLLQTFGELVGEGKEEEYAPIVGEALERLALASRRPAYVSSFAEGIGTRLYPLLLTVYHLGILAHFHGRPNYLRLLLTLQLPVSARTNDENTAIPIRTNFLRNSIPDGASH
jgi:hypothetical protein